MDDAEALHEATIASIEHLRPFMGFVVNEPQPLETRVHTIETWHEARAQEVDFCYAIVDEHNRLLGTCALHQHPGGRPATLEIGYWVRADSANKGVASAAVQCLLALARETAGICFVELQHDRANGASGRVAEKAGFLCLGEVLGSTTAPGCTGVNVLWRMKLQK